MGGIQTPVLFDSSSTYKELQVVKVFNSATLLTVGDWVVLDLSVSIFGLGATVKQSAADDEAVGVVGVVKAAYQQGFEPTTSLPRYMCEVVVYGPITGANVASGTGAGVGLQTSGVAGRAEAITATTEHNIGTTMAAASGTTAPVFVKCQ